MQELITASLSADGFSGGPHVPPCSTLHPPTAVRGSLLRIAVTSGLLGLNCFCEIGSESTPTGSRGGNVHFGDTKERIGLGGIPHLAPGGAHGAAEGPGREADQPFLARFPRSTENSLTEEQPA